jgi:hypothetical protein
MIEIERNKKEIILYYYPDWIILCRITKDSKDLLPYKQSTNGNNYFWNLRKIPIIFHGTNCGIF